MQAYVVSAFLFFKWFTKVTKLKKERWKGHAKSHICSLCKFKVKNIWPPFKQTITKQSKEFHMFHQSIFNAKDCIPWLPPVICGNTYTQNLRRCLMCIVGSWVVVWSRHICQKTTRTHQLCCYNVNLQSELTQGSSMHPLPSSIVYAATLPHVHWMALNWCSLSCPVTPCQWKNTVSSLPCFSQ